MVFMHESWKVLSLLGKRTAFIPLSKKALSYLSEVPKEAQAAYDQREVPDTGVDEIKPPEFGPTQVPENMSGDGYWETLSEGERLEIADVYRKQDLQISLVPLVLDHVDTLWAATEDRKDLSALMAVLVEICELEFKERHDAVN